MAHSSPIEIAGHSYSPETIELLVSVLDGAWAALSPDERILLPRSQIATRLLQATAEGERDPAVLRARALEGFRKASPDQPPLAAKRAGAPPTPA